MLEVSGGEAVVSITLLRVLEERNENWHYRRSGFTKVS